MKKFSKIAAIVSLAFLASTTAHSQEVFKVATGDLKAGSTYAQMWAEFAKVCEAPSGLKFESVPTNGGVKNKDLLVGNEVNAAILPSDLLFYTKSKNPASVKNIKTIFALHPEELHFVARADVKKEGGVFGFGGSKVTFNTVNDLAKRPVGAVGGSVVSGEIAAAQLGVPFTIREYQTNDLLKAALLSGEVDAILVVGGAPHGLVKSLDRNYKLLTIPADLVKKTTAGAGSLYAPALVDYPNLGQTGVATISTQAVFVSRVFRDKAMLNSLSRVRACFEDNLGKIQDTLKTHAKWQDVKVENHGAWQWYDLPSTDTTSTTSATSALSIKK